MDVYIYVDINTKKKEKNINEKNHVHR